MEVTKPITKYYITGIISKWIRGPFNNIENARREAIILSVDKKEVVSITEETTTTLIRVVGTETP